MNTTMKTPLKLLKNTQDYRKTPKGILTNSYGKQRDRRNVKYTLNQLHSKFLNDRRFLRLVDEWVKSGFNKQLKPTIDRINCMKDYTLNNIQILTWAENRYKQRFELKRIRARDVYMLLDNKIIQIFKSVSNAVRITGLSQSNISSCLNGRRRTCGGYEWSYENPELLEQRKGE